MVAGRVRQAGGVVPLLCFHILHGAIYGGRTPRGRSVGQLPGTLPARPACPLSLPTPLCTHAVLRPRGCSRMGPRLRAPVCPQPAAALELEALRLSLSNMHAAQLELAQTHLQREKDSALAELRDALSSRHAQELALLHSRQQLQLEEVALRCQRETGKPGRPHRAAGRSPRPRRPGPATAPRSPPSPPLVQLSSGLALTLKCGGSWLALLLQVSVSAPSMGPCLWPSWTALDIDRTSTGPSPCAPLVRPALRSSCLMHEGCLDRPGHRGLWSRVPQPGALRQLNGLVRSQH